ncbi:MAG: hypothetical protein RLZZ584_3536, partial [Pseudomonadota bacterium]
SLTGNTLANTLFAGAGNNVLDGGAGLDTVSYAFAAAGVSVNLALAGAQATGGSGSDTLVAIENLTGSSFADTLTGNAAANVLNGGRGADTLAGGDGSDTYTVDNIADVVTETNTQPAGGTDLVNSLLGAYTLGSSVENGRVLVTGTASLTGNNLFNTLFAGAGDNVLDGGAGLDTASYAYATGAVSVSLALAGAQATGGSGSDTLVSIENLTGSSFADTLAGNAAANLVSGGTGADTLAGGAGLDTLIGGAGNDVFVFDTAPDGTANVDRITDFAAGDRISLDNDLYTALGAPGALAAGQFHSGAGLTGGTGSGGVYYNVSTGDVYYDPDGTGAAAAVRFASLTGAPALTAASFEVRD